MQEKSRRRREKEREKGTGGWGSDKGKRNNCGGLKYRSKKHCRYYRLQGPVPPAGQRPARGILRDFGIPVLPGFGRYHRLEPVPPVLGAGTTGRAGKTALKGELVWQTKKQISHGQISSNHHKTMAMLEM